MNKAKMKNRRNQKAFLLATTELMVIVPVAVMLFFLILNASVIACSKMKLGAVAQEAAKYTSELDSDRDLEKEAAKFVLGVLSAAGQPVKSLVVRVKRIEICDSQAVTVTVEGKYPLIESNLLPCQIPLKETAVALLPSRKICGYVAISPDAYADPAGNRRPSVYCPIVRPNRRLPIWTFPYDTAIGSLHLERGTAPKLESSPKPGDAGYFSGLESLY